MSWVMKNWKPLTVVGGLLGISWFAGKKFDEAEAFDAESKMDCPPATKDVAINTKNRNATIKNFGYGPLNVEEPGDFWKDIAKQWKTTEKAAKKSKCGNCVAFDRSPRMKDCMPGETSDGEGVLGYCWMHHFKCHSARTCDTWAKGGPITTDKVSEGWQERAFAKSEKKEAETTMTVEHKDGSKYRYSETDPIYDVRGDVVGHVSEILYETPTYYQSIYDAETDVHDFYYPFSVFGDAFAVDWEDYSEGVEYPADEDSDFGGFATQEQFENNNGYPYGVFYLENGYIIEKEWFATPEERDKNLKSHNTMMQQMYAETFEADYDNDEDEHEMVHCSFCNDIIGTEEEVYDEESVEWYNANGETICPPCYKDWMKEYENDMDMRYTPFYADTVAFESFAGRWNVGQTKEIEGVQLTKVSNAYGRGNRRVGAGFIMEYEGHVGEIVANDEAGYRGQKPSFYVLEGGTLGRGRRRTRRGRFNGISAKDQRECLIRWKHKVGGGTLVIRRPFKKARAIRTSRGFRPYSGVYKPITGFVSKAYTFRRKSDGRTVMGKMPRQNEAWLGIRYDAESFEAESDDRVMDRFFEMAYAIIDMDGEVGIYDEDGGSFITYESWAELEEDMDSGEISINMMKDFLEERGVIPFWAESDSKKVKNTYRLGDREVREYADGSLEVVMDAESVSFKSFWIVAKKGSKLFPAGQVGELRVYDNGERTIVLDNNIVIPFYTQATAYAYLNKHFMVYPKRGKADMSLVMDAEGDHDHDHDDHDHEDIDELVEKIDRLTDFAITFIHDGGFGGEPQGFIVDEDLGLKTEIVKYVEGSMDLRMVRDLETNELVSVRFALSGDPDSTPILYLPLPEKIATVPQEERAIKRS